MSEQKKRTSERDNDSKRIRSPSHDEHFGQVTELFEESDRETPLKLALDLTDTPNADPSPRNDYPLDFLLVANQAELPTHDITELHSVPMGDHSSVSWKDLEPQIDQFEMMVANDGVLPETGSQEVGNDVLQYRVSTLQAAVPTSHSGVRVAKDPAYHGLLIWFEKTFWTITESKQRNGNLEFGTLHPGPQGEALPRHVELCEETPATAGSSVVHWQWSKLPSPTNLLDHPDALALLRWSGAELTTAREEFIQQVEAFLASLEPGSCVDRLDAFSHIPLPLGGNSKAFENLVVCLAVTKLVGQSSFRKFCAEDPGGLVAIGNVWSHATGEQFDPTDAKQRRRISHWFSDRRTLSTMARGFPGLLVLALHLELSLNTFKTFLTTCKEAGSTAPEVYTQIPEPHRYAALARSLTSVGSPTVGLVLAQSLPSGAEGTILPW